MPTPPTVPQKLVTLDPFKCPPVLENQKIHQRGAIFVMEDFTDPCSVKIRCAMHRAEVSVNRKTKQVTWQVTNMNPVKMGTMDESRVWKAFVTVACKVYESVCHKVMSRHMAT